MRGTEPYRQCWCRDPETGKPLRSKCPKLKNKKHGKWYARYDAGGSDGRRRQPVVGPFDTKKECEEELANALARIGGGGSAPDRKLRVAAYLDAYIAGKRNLKPRTLETDSDAFRLYWTPAIGHMRLVDIRDHHVSDVITAMEVVNRPQSQAQKLPQAVSEMLRRMTTARADDERRVLHDGEARHKKSTKPLSPARVARMFAPFRAAMNAAVPKKIGVSPCDGVELPRARTVKPLAWTTPREAAFREELEKRLREAEVAKGKRLTTVERQKIWAAPDLRPCPVMVWLPAHCGQFLDCIEGERLFAVFIFTMFSGLRQDEVVGLNWAEVDLDEAVAYVRQNGSGDDPKSDAGVRAVPLPKVVVQAIKSWRRRQAAERLAWGPDWPDTSRVFTDADGMPVTGQWLSRRFATLAWRADLPYVRFHDLRHGAASLAKAAGASSKEISQQLGHSRQSFTDTTYVTVFPDVAKAAAEAAAALVPRKNLAQDS